MNQVFHPWTEWECYSAGMYDGETELSSDAAKNEYASFLRDIPRFQKAMKRVMHEWPRSCEHFLTNANSNRLAWLGQAAMCIDTGLSRRHRAGYMLLTSEERHWANKAAEQALNEWVKAYEKANRRVRAAVEDNGLFG